MPEIDLCLGTNEKKEIVKYVEEYWQKGKKEALDDVFENKDRKSVV